MNEKQIDIGTDNVQRILCVLGMPRTVPIMRYMHMNGWFPVQGLCGALAMEREEVLDHLEAMEKVGLVESRWEKDFENSAQGSNLEFRLIGKIPNIDLARLATSERPFLRCVKFYSNLVFNTLERVKEVRSRVYPFVSTRVMTTNGWRDPKAKAVMSCFDFAGGAISTYANFKRMVARGVLTFEDIHILKRVSLTMMVVLISTLEDRTDRNLSRLLIRVASRDLIDEFRPELEKHDLLESLPHDYFRQIQ